MALSENWLPVEAPRGMRWLSIEGMYLEEDEFLLALVDVSAVRLVDVSFKNVASHNAYKIQAWDSRDNVVPLYSIKPTHYLSVRGTSEKMIEEYENALKVSAKKTEVIEAVNKTLSRRKK